MLHEMVMASILPKPQKPTPADPLLFSISTPRRATLVLRPNRRCHATTRQTRAVRYTAGMEKKIHWEANFEATNFDSAARSAENRAAGAVYKWEQGDGVGRGAGRICG